MNRKRHMVPRESITPDVLRELIIYYPLLGSMRWKPRTQEKFTGGQPLNTVRSTNSRLTNRSVGSIHTNTGFKRIHIFGWQFVFHRVAWAMVYNRWPTHQVIHLNTKKLDNRIDNLFDGGANLVEANPSKQYEWLLSTAANLIIQNVNGEWLYHDECGQMPDLWSSAFEGRQVHELIYIDGHYIRSVEVKAFKGAK